MLPQVKKSIPCCLLTSKSTDIFVYNWFGQLSLVLDMCIFLSRFRLYDYFTGESRTQDLYFSLKQWFGVTYVLIDSFFLQTQLFTGVRSCGFLLDYSDGTHSLQRIHCWASDVMLHLSKSVLMKKKTKFGLFGKLAAQKVVGSIPREHTYLTINV